LPPPNWTKPIETSRISVVRDVADQFGGWQQLTNYRDPENKSGALGGDILKKQRGKGRGGGRGKEGKGGKGQEKIGEGEDGGPLRSKGLEKGGKEGEGRDGKWGGRGRRAASRQGG